MSVKALLIAATFGMIIWLLGDLGGPPELAEVFSPNNLQEKNNSQSAEQAEKPMLVFDDADSFKKWQLNTRSSYKRALDMDDEYTYVAEVITLRTSAGSKLSREYLLLVAEDGLRIPIVIQYPVGKKNLPAVIVIPGHTKEGESGLQQLTEDEDSYHHAAASAIAEAGFVTVAFELRGFGLLGPPNYPEHKIVAYNQLRIGGTYKGLVLKDILAVQDYVKTLEMVDGTRIGVAGASLGGELSVALAAIAPSIKTVVFSSYVERGTFTAFDSSHTKQPHYCHLIPGLGSFMRKEDIFRLLAPRASLGIRGKKGENQMTEFAERIAQNWKFYDEKREFKFVEVQGGGHEFYVDKTIEFLKQNL